MTENSSSSVQVLSMQQAINRALRESMQEDPRSIILGEDVGVLGGVFRVTDGLASEFGAERVRDTPLAESGIIGLSVGLAMAGYHPIPEIQFDGFSYPATNQIVTQLARMTYRSRGALTMPVTVRVPSFGGINAPEMHSESLEALFVHTPGLKVVSPATPHEAYHLLSSVTGKNAKDPVIFMEPKARYWHKQEVDLDRPGNLEGARIARAGKHVSLIAWGAQVAQCLDVAELAAEDGIEVEVLDLRWLSPIDEDALRESVQRTRRAVVVHEAPLTAGLGSEIAALISSSCFDILKAPVERVTGFDVPYPAGNLEEEYLPNIDRILFGIQRTLEYRRG